MDTGAIYNHVHEKTGDPVMFKSTSFRRTKWHKQLVTFLFKPSKQHLPATLMLHEATHCQFTSKSGKCQKAKPQQNFTLLGIFI